MMLCIMKLRLEKINIICYNINVSNLNRAFGSRPPGFRQEVIMEFRDYLLMPIKMKFAEFAEKAEKTIKEKYKESFGIGNQEIQVYSTFCSDCSSVASLTIDGVWKWHDDWCGGRNYEIKCTAEDIFENFVKLIEDDEIDNTMDCALHDFMNWVFNLPTWKEVDNNEEIKEYLLKNSLNKYFR